MRPVATRHIRLRSRTGSRCVLSHGKRYRTPGGRGVLREDSMSPLVEARSLTTCSAYVVKPLSTLMGWTGSLGLGSPMMENFRFTGRGMTGAITCSFCIWIWVMYWYWKSCYQSAILCDLVVNKVSVILKTNILEQLMLQTPKSLQELISTAPITSDSPQLQVTRL